jgi:sarcosine oxidase subunit alpha
MNVLRIEKGHVVIGAEIDGRATPDDLGFGRMLKQDGDYVGRRSLDRPALANGARKQLVGLLAEDAQQRIPTGAQLVDSPDVSVSVPTLGHVTSATSSPNLNKTIALGVVINGRQRVGESIYALSPLTDQCVNVTITEPVFFDPEGDRARA